MSMTDYELNYALAKQVPAMRIAVTLSSDYGELELHGQAANQVADAVERVLRAKLAQWQRMQREQCQQQAEREARD